MYTLLVRHPVLENLHTSLPIEYQLKYGTACGYLNGPNLVSNAASNGISGVYGAFPQEELLCEFWINPRPLVVDSLDSLVIGLDRG